MITRRLPDFISLLLAMILTGACGKVEDAKVATQVAARVNGDEITVHQINLVLARSQNITPELTAQARREILDRLIDEHLAKQKAIENGLDRSANVLQAIEAAKSEILARAYLEHITAGQRILAPAETHEYYKRHPELFEQRRVFSLQEFAFVANDEVAGSLRGRLPSIRSMQEIADWLHERGIQFAVNQGVRAAEQIPLEILPKVQAMKEGEIQLLDAGNGRFQVIRVAAFKAAPVDEATATPRIRQFLSNRNAREVIAREMKKIKEQAKIEYVGEFAGIAVATEPKVKPKAAEKARAETEAKPTPFKYSWEVEPQFKQQDLFEERSQK